MATFLHRIGRTAFRRRWLVVLLWALVLGAVGVGAANGSGPQTSNVTLPGTEAQRANDLLEKQFPAANADGASARVVLRAPGGEKIGSADNRAALKATLAEVKKSSAHIAKVSDPFAAKAVSANGSTAYSQVTYSVPDVDLTDRDHSGLDKALESGRDQGLTVEASGNALQPPEESHSAEVIGFALAAVILLITFGSLVAAGLPLVTALVGVAVSMTAITALSGPFDLNSNASVLATMLGIAVGIDYALFIVSRYRSERADGYDAEEAAARANGTAGSAVVFAGLTVVIALAGLAVVNLSILTAMGLAAAGAVAVAVLVAVTLMPALLGFAGERVVGRGRKRFTRRFFPGRAEASATGPAEASATRPAEASATRPTPAGPARTGLAQRWIAFVLRKPAKVLVLAVLALGVIALPATKLELGLPDDGSKTASSTQRKAYDMLSQSFGPGFNGPLTVTVDNQDPAVTRTGAAALGKSLKELRDVTAVTPAVFNKAGDTALFTVVPKSAPGSDATKELVGDIRSLADRTGADTGARALVTGTTALNIDVSDKFSKAIVPYLALVVGLAVLVLILVFRSILVPLKAALGFLLSVLASLGAIVAVFQWGWLKDLIGLEQTGPLMSLMPILMVGIVFGLAMDYQVFLVTRMREAYVHGADARTAVAEGFRHSATVVTVAALIMITVFAGFIGSEDAMIKALGFGLAVAVAFDAFVVRMTIVPAALALLGKRAWSLPGWLDRILPHVDIEGEKLARAEPAPPQSEQPERPGHRPAHDYSGRS
ncbi:MMPL family transporter [Streptomyces flavofungini]|uniref:MMPL family transporter n=1 Tax=Streptomyces flavofungini TaxID=68200 RepID=A0ABS0X8F0_9ACTN|nr:MMPL family transporter [Streptomyces flavofungini]MBJ3809475.1 MMPL family transporter [Streptomyces flavofungini]GHC54982.1 membrane protein [Streptomyces flavofungini]